MRRIFLAASTVAIIGAVSPAQANDACAFMVVDPKAGASLTFATAPQFDNAVISLVGDVIVTFKGHALCADRFWLTRDGLAGIATGKVVMIDPDRNVTQAEKLTLEPAVAQQLVDELFGPKK